MEVTRENFNEVFEKIRLAIERSDFIAIDGEFTGLDFGFTTNHFDTAEERYQKLRQNCANYLLIQFGLCTFHYDSKSSKYLHEGFNFYIFPRYDSCPLKIPDVIFSCQNTSLDFLAAQGFDFNKLIQKGIPYLNLEDEVRLHEELELKQNQNHYSEEQKIKVPDEHKEYVLNTCNQIEKFLHDGKEMTFNISPCNNPFIRLLIYQEAKKRFSSLCTLDTKVGENRQRYIMVRRIMKNEDPEEIEKSKKQKQLNELENAVGFTKVIKLLRSSGKLIIGHNMFLDILHIMKQFICPLPKDYREFKELVRGTFPKLLDTKLLASSSPLKNLIRDTSLGELQKILSEKPFSKHSIAIAEDYKGYELSDEKFHEAGYDAFITGVCFITLANHLGSLEENEITENAACESNLLLPFQNKFYIKTYDVPHIDLDHDDVLPNRSHILHLTFPKEWRKNDIMQLFQPFGNIFVSWLNETSAFIALNEKNQVEVALKTLTQNDIYQVVPYVVFKKLSNTQPSFGTKRILSEHTDSPVPKRSRSLDKKKIECFSPIPEDLEDYQKDEDVGEPVARKLTEETFPLSDSWE